MIKSYQPEAPGPKEDKSKNNSEKKVAKATRELEQLEMQIKKSRIVLARLHREIVQAGNVWAKQPELVKVNEQLVLATLNAQTEAEVRTQALKKMSQSVELDPLTELPNRVRLMDRLAQAITTAKRNSAHLALLFVDLNKFKNINDTLGHGAGDEVLIRVAHCLTTSVREVDTVCRYGGDEFIILLAEVSQTSDAVIIADKVHSALGIPSRINNQMLSLTASIGISIYPDHGEAADTLIERADAAMYQAKKNNLGSFVYSDEESRDEPTKVQ